MSWHGYVWVEPHSINLTAGQKAAVLAWFSAMGPVSANQPCHLNHIRTQGTATIYECLFEDSDLTEANFAAILAAAMSVGVETITTTTKAMSLTGPISYLYVLEQGGSERLRIARFSVGQDWYTPSWDDSHAECLSAIEEFAGGTVTGSVDGRYFDGVDGNGVDIYSHLGSWDGDTFTILMRARVADILAWLGNEKGENRRLFHIGADGNNEVYATAHGDDAYPRLRAEAGSSYVEKNMIAHYPTGWFVFAIDVDWEIPSQKLYFPSYTPAYTRTTVVGGPWVGALDSGACVIGDHDLASSQQAPWWGWISDMIITFGVASLDEVAIPAICAALLAGTLTEADLNTEFGAGNWAWATLTDTGVSWAP